MFEAPDRTVENDDCLIYIHRYERNSSEAKRKLKSEYNKLVQKWNKGVLRGAGFEVVTIVVTYMNQDGDLSRIYIEFVQKWNNGKLTGRDFREMTEYLTNI